MLTHTYGYVSWHKAVRLHHAYGQTGSMLVSANRLINFRKDHGIDEWKQGLSLSDLIDYRNHLLGGAEWLLLYREARARFL